MAKTKLISFDLDGTLVDPTYTKWVWEIGIPQLYAQKNKLTVSEAIAMVTNEYKQIGDTSLAWYDIKFWFKEFNLPGNWQDLMKKYREKIRLYPEVKEVLTRLRQHYDLIITSNAAREFVEMEVEKTGIKGYFTRIFSATSDFQQVKKTPQFYKEICRIIGVAPSQTIHVGDHYEFDYLAPRQLGINAYYLDRNGTDPKNNFILKNLKDFIRFLK